jgi:lipoic acid synthetase
MDETFAKPSFNIQSKAKLNVLPQNKEESVGRFPSWLHRKIPSGGKISETNRILSSLGLNTVCEEAKCPNRLECYSHNTATFLALGKACTRACGFCDIDFTKTPKAPDPEEPKKIAEACLKLGLEHVVITMVARDDLEDQGSMHIAKIIEEIRNLNKNLTTEVLVSDFSGSFDAIINVIQARPGIYNHNLETVRRLTPKVRHKATYERSLEVLSYVKKVDPTIPTKSGMMLGLGETKEEVCEAIKDLAATGLDILTLGQYLQASRLKIPVKEFVTPEQFKYFEDFARECGIKEVFAGPFVRSSYHAFDVKKSFEKAIT